MSPSSPLQLSLIRVKVAWRNQNVFKSHHWPTLRLSGRSHSHPNLEKPAKVNTITFQSDCKSHKQQHSKHNSLTKFIWHRLDDGKRPHRTDAAPIFHQPIDLVNPLPVLDSPDSDNKQTFGWRHPLHHSAAKQQAKAKLREEEISQAQIWLEDFVKARWGQHWEFIKITCDLFPSELQQLGHLEQAEGWEACRHLVQIPVLHDEVALALWKQLAADVERVKVASYLRVDGYDIEVKSAEKGQDTMKDEEVTVSVFAEEPRNKKHRLCNTKRQQRLDRLRADYYHELQQLRQSEIKWHRLKYSEVVDCQTRLGRLQAKIQTLEREISFDGRRNWDAKSPPNPTVLCPQLIRKAEKMPVIAENPLEWVFDRQAPQHHPVPPPSRVSSKVAPEATPSAEMRCNADTDDPSRRTSCSSAFSTLADSITSSSRRSSQSSVFSTESQALSMAILAEECDIEEDLSVTGERLY